MSDHGKNRTNEMRDGLSPKERAAHDYICGNICSKYRGVPPEVLKQVIVLAIEIAREGREGRKIGTMFVIGDAAEVLARSKCLILDPLAYHPRELKSVFDYDMRETAKELAGLDGAFVLDDEGVFLSACRYLDSSSRDIDMPLGLGSRHMAGASISLETGAVAVVVSESSMVRVFDDGELISEIIPEVWLMSRHSLHLEGPYEEHTEKDVTFISKAEDE
jgi:DNA integrity scanning protein DisA with diadenylate cyclase activity